MENRDIKRCTAKLCFEHLGGKLGERLFARLVELNWFVRDDERRTHYHLTEIGVRELEKLGVDIYERS